MKCVALERLDALYARQLGIAEKAGTRHYEARGDAIAAAGRDDPAVALFIPSQPPHLCLEQCGGVEVEPLGKLAAMGEDF